ncbi:MAG: class I SAM-dependent methyltransferase [Pseudomonadota bacterium]
MRVFELAERAAWTPAIPAEFVDPYRLGEYSENRITQTMWKYLVREQNCQRAWARINHHMPETLMPGAPLDILEFSTAHGAMLEIWQHYGHRCVGTDYAWTVQGQETVKGKGVRKPWHETLIKELRGKPHGRKTHAEVPGWPYQTITESLGLDVRLFDGGLRRYPFEDDSFDLVCCFQAIEAYTGPEGWLDTIREFCRIARKTVVVGFNPLPVETAENQDMRAAAREAWLALQSFDELGFRTTFFEIGQTRRGIHPTVCKLIAT